MSQPLRTSLVCGALAASLVTLGGCHSGSDQGVDLGSDLASSAVDLRRGDGELGSDGPRDFVGHVFSCFGSDAPGSRSQQATNHLLLPQSTGSQTFTLDLDGDGRPDNQLKNVMQVLTLAGADVQGTLDASVAAGGLVYLLGVSSSDVDNSSCAGITLHLAKPRGSGDPAPRYDGTDSFTKGGGVDTELSGKIVAGRLSSIPPSKLTASQESRFTLSLSLLGATVSVPVRGAYLDGTLTSVGGQLGIQSGSLHGAIAKGDIDNILMPGLAKGITHVINGDPTGATTMSLISLFENPANAVTKAKCMVDRDCCRTSPATCRILPEEVAMSPIGGVFAPDVQVFNDAGDWAPTPGGRTKNGMSIGFGFSSVPATF